MEYGFRRNCLGLRPVALAVAIGAFAVSVLLLFLADASQLPHYGVSAVIAAVAGYAWCRLVSPAWVKRAAELYADRLFEAIASITS